MWRAGLDGDGSRWWGGRPSCRSCSRIAEGGAVLDAAADLIARGDTALGHRTFERLLLRCLMLDVDDAPEPLLREAIAYGDPRGEVQLARWCRGRLRRAGLPLPRPTRDGDAVPERLRARA